MLSFTIKAQIEIPTQGSFDIVATSKILISTNFSDDVNTVSSSKFGQPLNYVGISSTNHLIVNRTHEFQGYIGYSQLIPQTVSISDTIDAQINGFNLSICLAGCDFVENRNLDFITCFGFNTGRI